MTSTTVPKPKPTHTEQPSAFEASVENSGVVTTGPVATPVGAKRVWEFVGIRLEEEQSHATNAANLFSTKAQRTSPESMTRELSDRLRTFLSSERATPLVSVLWPAPSRAERRLQNALELDRAEIGFDADAAGILGRLYDLGQASEKDLADWFQSAHQWIAFSRVQRCRYIEDLGTQFTLSREGRQFVEEMLGEDAGG